LCKDLEKFDSKGAQSWGGCAKRPAWGDPFGKRSVLKKTTKEDQQMSIRSMKSVSEKGGKKGPKKRILHKYKKKKKKRGGFVKTEEPNVKHCVWKWEGPQVKGKMAT